MLTSKETLEKYDNEMIDNDFETFYRTLDDSNLVFFQNTNQIDRLKLLTISILI